MENGINEKIEKNECSGNKNVNEEINKDTNNSDNKLDNQILKDCNDKIINIGTNKNENKNDHINENKFPSLIDDKLYLGNLFDAKKSEHLKSLNITHILIVGNGLCKLFPNEFTYKHIKIDDESTENIYQHFNESIDFINNGINSGGVFVHCAFGQSRSATIVIAYIMKKYMKTFEDAFNFVQSNREMICPNKGFCCSLIEYQFELGLKSETETIKELNEYENKKIFNKYMN